MALPTASSSSSAIARRRRVDRGCKVADCGRPHLAKGLCAGHYERQRRHGSPAAGKPLGVEIRSECSLDGCGRPHAAHGYCYTHYRRFIATGDPLIGTTGQVVPIQPSTKVRTVCSVEACDTATHQKGFCRPHYLRWWKYGDPEHVPERRKRAICSEEGCEKPSDAKGRCKQHYAAWKRATVVIDPVRWLSDERASRCQTANGYTLVTMNGRSELEHRLVMEASIGRPLTRDESVHHRNGVRSDNRLENLELWATKHPPGQRVEDLIAWICDQHRDLFRRMLIHGEGGSVPPSVTLDDLQKIAALDARGEVRRRMVSLAHGRQEIRVRVEGRYLSEHRAMAMVMLGRSLAKGETVHHRNGDPLDNRPSNLEIWSKHHPSGQRVSDLVEWLIRDHYPACLSGAEKAGIAKLEPGVGGRGHTQSCEPRAA